MVFVLIRKHEIDIETGTVRRDHIKFPDVKQKKSTFKKKIILEEKWKLISEFLVDGDKVVSKRNISVEKSYRGKNAPTALKTQRPSSVQQKKTRTLTAEPLVELEKVVFKKRNYSLEESDKESGDHDPTLSELVKRKLSSVKKKKTAIIKEKTIVEENKSELTSAGSVGRDKAVLKRRTPSCSKRSAPTISKQKEKPSFVDEKNYNLVKKKTIVQEKRKLTSESLVDKAVSKKKHPSLEESYGERNSSTTPKQKQKPSSIEVKKTSLVQKKTIVEEQRKLTPEHIVNGDDAVSKKGSSLEESTRATASSVPKLKQKSASSVKVGSNKNREKTFSRIDISRKVKQNNLLRKELTMSEQIKTSLDEKPFSSMESEQVKLGNPDTTDADTAVQIHKEMPPHTECGDDGNKSCMCYATANGGSQVNIPDDAGRRCITSNDEPHSSVTNPGSGNEKGCKRESSGKPYSNGMEQRLRTEFDIVAQACINRKRDPHFSIGNDLIGQDSVYDHIRTFSSTFYSYIGTVADSLSSLKGLAMPSDASKLDDPRAPQPNYLDRCIGFASGPHPNYSLQNSAGWLDE